MRKRLLHIVTTLHPGGAENALLHLLPRLDFDRFEIRVAWLKGSGDLADRFREIGIPAESLEMLGPFDLRAPARAATLARRWRPHLVHTHLFKADVVGALAARSARACLVSTKHNEDPQLRLPGIRGLATRVARQADTVVAISDAVRSHVHAHLPLPPEKVRVIRYGLDVAAVDALPDAPDLRAELGLPAGTPLLLFAGRIVPQKALPVLISAMVRICQAAPGACLAIAGRGPLEEDVRERTRALGLENAVRFLGFRPDVPALMRQADLLALPSRWEGLGRVLLEAMAARCPVVASRVGAIPEVIVDGETGRLVRPDDPDALADAALSLLADFDRREQMGQEGRRVLRERFTTEAEVAATEALYDELISRRFPEKARKARRRSRRRVLLVSRPGTAGAARHVSFLAASLDLERFDLHAALSPVENAAFPAEIREAGATVTEIPLFRAIRLGSDWRALRRLLALVRKTKPDLIHAHASKAGVLARIVGAWTRTRTLYSPHGWAFGYVGNGPLGTLLARGAERAMRPLTDGLLCVSPSEACAARRHGLARRDRIHTVPNAVDPEEFRDLPDRAEVRRRLGIPEDARVALMIGRLTEQKDPLTFVKAGAFLALGPRPPRMLLVGDGPLHEACLDLAIETGLEDTVVCPGRIDDVRSLMAAADVLVLSTRYEGLPYVLLEGLAAGLPVIASDVPGCRAVLAGGRGRLVPPGDAPALGRAIEEAFDEPRTGPRLPPGFDLDTWIRRIEDVYDEMTPTVSAE